MIRYERPRSWLIYRQGEIFQPLVEAKAAILSLTQIPYQRQWTEHLQAVQLKREVAGTSRIEGADFTEQELDEALSSETPGEFETRSQRQARAVVSAYRWIAEQPEDRPLDEVLLLEIHRRIIEGADDDHCPPGRIRGRDQNVHFGAPRHRGVEGGDDCEAAFTELCTVVGREFLDHDPLIRALALHYHLAAMHPFLDGNGRTARAAEALLLQRMGLRDTLFIAMSNYYYEEKTGYLEALSTVRARQHDLTPFLVFGLKGITLQCRRLFSEIRRNVSKALFRNVMFDLFKRLQTERKRVIADRQLAILELLLTEDRLNLDVIEKRTKRRYAALKNPYRALIRDLNHLLELGALALDRPDRRRYILSINLDWPTEITETEFFERVRSMPKAKTNRFLS